MNEDTTLSRPLRRRDVVIALVLLTLALTIALWRSDLGHFPDTVTDRSSSNTEVAPGTRGE